MGTACYSEYKETPLYFDCGKHIAKSYFKKNLSRCVRFFRKEKTDVNKGSVMGQVTRTGPYVSNLLRASQRDPMRLITVPVL